MTGMLLVEKTFITFGFKEKTLLQNFLNYTVYFGNTKPLLPFI